MNRSIASIALMAAMTLAGSTAVAAEDAATLSVLQQPAKLIAVIYQRHHDWKTDEGIALATKALTDLDPMLRSDPDGEIADPRLKTRRVRQIASTLHTLLGMLDQRQGLKLLQDESGRRNKRLAEYDKANGKLESADIEQRIAAERASAKLSATAVKELRTAIEIDAKNPSPHYELAKLYAAGLPGGTAAAEEEYYLAALCSFDEGDSKAAQSTMGALAALNPKSKFLAQFERKRKTVGSAK